jgi:hypothetical protein
MIKELTDQLYELCPNVYYNNENDLYGIETGNGWYSLIEKLSLQLEEILLKIPEQERKNYRAIQIKQKFGLLRFYLSDSTPEMDALILQAEENSGRICEICGEPGEIVNISSARRTRCVIHSDRLRHW